MRSGQIFQRFPSNNPAACHYQQSVIFRKSNTMRRCRAKRRNQPAFLNSGLLPALLLSLPALLFSSCHDKHCPPEVPVSPSVSLVRIEVTPASPTIPLGDQQQFIATGFYEDGSQGDLTSTATWTSSDTLVATVSDEGGTKGLASSASLGATEITATKDSVAGSTTLTVVAAALRAIEVTPANPTVPAGAQVPFRAIGHFSDSSTRDVT